MKYLLSALLIVMALIVGKTLVPAHAADQSSVAMAPTQFGTYSEEYLKRKREREERRRQMFGVEHQCFYRITEQQRRTFGDTCFYEPQGPDGCLPETCREDR